MSGFEASIPALRQEAGIWEGVASQLAAVARATDGVSLSAAQMSFASLESDLGGAYAGFVSRFAQYAYAGEREATNIGRKLDDTATSYETGDEEGSSGLRTVDI